MEKKENITVKTLVNLPVQKVWYYWTTAEHVTGWNFADTSWHCPKAVNELKPGGRFSYRMEARDGSAGFDFSGKYTHLVQGVEIQYTLDDERKVSIVFESEGSTTKVIETFEAEQMNSPELQQTGWQMILDNFRKYAENKG